jgi:beta-xylosidase
LLAVLAMLAGTGSGIAPVARARGTVTQTYQNPVFARDFPDPFVLKVGNVYYAYGTTTAWEPLNHEFPILRSTDLVHWRYVADVFTSAPSWGFGDWWAPDMVVRGGTYFLYYVGNSVEYNEHCIGVATAHTPTGPFTDHGSLACGDASGQGYIDPDPFIDSNGKAYLYISVDNPYHSISVLPLAPDLLHVAGPRKQLFTLSQHWEYGAAFSTVEGPFMVKRNGRYYLFYSGNDWQHDYAMGYATATLPLGPFTKYAHDPVLHGTAKVTGPGGGSLFQGPGGGWWLAYHAWTGGPGYSSGGVRNLRIDRVSWRGNSVVVDGPTTTPQPAP